jgi:opacity protein-like surface antigen
MSHGVNCIGPTLEYRWPASKRWELYGGGGPIWYVNHPESTINGMSLEKYQASGWGWQVLGGVSFRVTERWVVFGELTFSSGRARHDVAGDGRFEVDLRSTHSVIGVGYRFD